MFKKDCVEWTMKRDSWRSPEDVRNDDGFEPPPMCNPDNWEADCADDKFGCLKPDAGKACAITNFGPGRCTCL